MKKKISSICIIYLGFLLSCGDSTPKPKGEFDGAEHITRAEFIETTSSTTLRAIASQAPGFSSLVNNISFQDVDAYKITYNTVDVNGATIAASGLLMYPPNISNPPLLSYQHGTLYTLEEAPSNFSASASEVLFTLVMSGAGYAVILPDYLGYGASSSIQHPYEHGTTLGSASYDMLVASREFFQIRNITLSDKIFITGYSEGGYATMALHQHIEQQSNLEITMSAPAAGAHNKTAFTLDVIESNENLTFLPNYLWVLDTYNKVYNINKPWIDYVVEPYATTLNGITNPMLLENANVSLNPQELFQASFRNAIINGTDTDFLAALKDNDRFDWTPRAPITLYHGTADDFVIPLNSRTAFEAIQANGGNVTLVEFEGKDHGTAVADYLIAVFNLFEDLK